VEVLRDIEREALYFLLSRWHALPSL
jgi:hypothetical protein